MTGPTIVYFPHTLSFFHSAQTIIIKYFVIFHFWMRKNLKYKTVLMREGKGHTICRVASAHSAVLSWGGGGLPHPWPWLGTPSLDGGYLSRDGGVPHLWTGVPPPV